MAHDADIIRIVAIDLFKWFNKQGHDELFTVQYSVGSIYRFAIYQVVR